MGRALVMQQLHFAAEVRSVDEVPVEEAEVRDAELKLARQIIDQQTSERFEPLEYVDQVRQRIDAAIQKKVEEGREIALAEPEAPAGGKVIDLMAALKASLEKQSAAAPPKLGARKPPKRVTKEKEPREKRKTSRG
jgi:DNA end-binding protein Ku